MPVKLETNGSKLTALLSGDLDHYTVSDIRTEIDRMVRGAPIDQLILDFANVSFMDSSGVGLVLGRYKLINEMGGRCIVANPPNYIAKVMKLSGIGKLCRIIYTSNAVKTNESDGGVKL
ncbi:MAG: anti-sigma factor antagonist [Ruminococcus sp.]|nr:anti-sigma factor antagonist [Ruminococcus sp.]